MLSMTNIDLSKNVIHDEVFLGELYQYKTSINNEYPNDKKIYEVVSSYYKVEEKNIAIGLGSGEVLSRIISNMGIDTLHVIEPTFHGAERFCNNSNVKYIPIYYKDFNKINLEDLPTLGCVYVANPNGNNGHSFTREEIQYLLDNNDLVILDEAYIDYGSDSFINNIQNNLIVLRTFSKSLGLPGIRCGFCVSTVSNIKKIRSTELPYCSTYSSGLILEKYIDKIPSIVKRMKEGKEFIQALYSHLPSDGCYVLLDKEHEEIFKNKILYSYRGDYIRIALTNKRIFENIWRESLKKLI